MRGQATLTKDEAEKLVQSACAAMATELDRLRAALAEAERERDEARVARDEIQQALSDGAYTSPDLSDVYLSIIERQRRTIDALVVAARVARLAAVGFAFIAGVGPRRVHDEIRFGIKQAKQAERGQAGDEQS